MRGKGEDMGSLEKWLRPFVQRKGWDYCVVWKLGDDPSRFIELVGCICGACSNVKVEKDEKLLGLGPLCRDTHFQHPIRTEACEALAQFPAFMSLYAGGSRVHGEVVISNQPMWLTAADSEPSNEGVGTRVLVPISGGLIELFTSKHIPKDQNMLELVSTQCNALEAVKSETITPQSSTNVSINEQILGPLLEENMQKMPLSFHSSMFIPVPKPIASPSPEGLSISSNIPVDSLSFQNKPKQMIKSSGIKRASSGGKVLKQGAAFVFVRNKKSAKDNARVPTRSQEKVHYHSKNLETERKRRNRIKDGLFTLRALVPNITKMDRSAILGDAIDYMKELEDDERKLRQELKELENDEKEQEKTKLKSGRLDKVKETNSGLCNTTEIEKKGGFRRLMETLNVLSIRVIDANVTSLDGKMRNTLRVEVNKDLQPKKLRDQLARLISIPTELPTS